MAWGPRHLGFTRPSLHDAVPMAKGVNRVGARLRSHERGVYTPPLYGRFSILGPSKETHAFALDLRGFHPHLGSLHAFVNTSGLFKKTARNLGGPFRFGTKLAAGPPETTTVCASFNLVWL